MSDELNIDQETLDELFALIGQAEEYTPIDDSELSERDQVDILHYGPRGVSWLERHGAIDKANPLLFTCAVCRRTLAGFESLHEKGCKVELMNRLGM